MTLAIISEKDLRQLLFGGNFRQIVHLNADLSSSGPMKRVEKDAFSLDWAIEPHRSVDSHEREESAACLLDRDARNWPNSTPSDPVAAKWRWDRTGDWAMSMLGLW